MRTIGADEIEEHRTEKSCWVVRRGRVYDVTDFVNNHPGGAQLILDFAGNDLTLLMNASDPHVHSRNAYRTLQDMQIGVLAGHENDRGIYEEEREPVDWSKPLLNQVARMGRNYSKWVHTPNNRWVRLFQNDFIELFSKAPWYLVPMFWVPVIIFFVTQNYHTLERHPQLNFFGAGFTIGPWALPLIVLLGCATWPLLEYFLHRFIFHLEPSGDVPFLIRFHFTMHGLHHKAPFDPYHLVFPPFPAAIIGLVIYGIFNMLLPACLVDGWAAGTAIGYVFYDLTHYYVHHGHPEPNSYFGRLKKWHIRHHYIDSDNGFGVSSNFLDVVFGTQFANFKYK